MNVSTQQRSWTGWKVFFDSPIGPEETSAQPSTIGMRVTTKMKR
jgi:hypothetical protein